MARIPTRLHGMLDYSVALGLIAAPRLLRFDAHSRAARIPMALGASTMLYSLLTDYELGALPVIPMPAHLAIDAANGAFLATSPWLLGFADSIWKPHLALGVLELVVVALSEHRRGG